MTPVFCCGFECGQSAAHWAIDGVGATFATAIKRNGARSMKLTGTSSSCTLSNNLTSTTGGVLRFYVYFVTLPTSNAQIVSFQLAGTGGRGAMYFKQADSKLYTTTSIGSNDSSSGYLVDIGRWYQIDMTTNVIANPWLIDAKIDGTSLPQLSNAVAANTFNNIVTSTNAGNGEFYIDDVIISQTLADYPIGAGYVNHFIPTSDGTHNIAGANDFERSATGTDITNATTTAYQLIDDVPMETGAPTDWINLIAPPNATDYVEVIFGAASGINVPLVAPRAVEVINAYTSSATGTNNLRLAVNDNGTLNDAFNANAALTTTNCKYTTKQYAAGPAGAWTVIAGAGNFNNVRMRCFTNDPAPDPYWVSAMIEAEFKEILFNKPLFVKQAVNRAGTY